jgi:hypothetical protein
MKIFMSWSGQRSKLTAELLYDWIKCVIQAAQPWISSKGIERGALWFSEINNELKDTAIGIICLTHENKNAPWILFEAGALAKGLSTNRVCTLLIDITPSDLQPPLAQFNHTFSDKESMWSLVTTLNNGLEGNRLDPTILRRVFETYWPQFETEFSILLKNNPPDTVAEPRDEKDILAEILESTRSMSSRVRNLEERYIKPTDNSARRARERAIQNLATDEMTDSLTNAAIQSIQTLTLKGIEPENMITSLMKAFNISEGKALELIGISKLV